ncbi:MAG: hypothetical protein IPJ49_25735 [Candidatus Obscuribacter sp.]|nr:hypothetical protein [Candidatus Obscuribacter sp.]
MQKVGRQMGKSNNPIRLIGVAFGATLLCTGAPPAPAADLTVAPVVQEIKTTLPETITQADSTNQPTEAGQKDIGQKQTPSQSVTSLQVPLFALLSNSDKYSGKLVTTQGFMHFRDEDYELYPSRDFGNFRLSLDGLWLDFSRDEHRSGKSHTLGINLSALDNQYVTLTGIFDTQVKGRFNFSIGGFRSISKIILIAPDKFPKAASTATTPKSVVNNAKK